MMAADARSIRSCSCITGNPDLGPILTSYLGTLLLASCYLSMGVLFSSMTENQIVAGALTFAAGLFFWLISWATQSAGPVWSDVPHLPVAHQPLQQLRPGPDQHGGRHLLLLVHRNRPFPHPPGP